MKVKGIVSIVLILVMSLLITTISYADGEMKLDKENMTIKLGRKEYIYLENKPVGETATWASSDTSVATVDEFGAVTALKIGKATITATVGTKKLSCSVSVEYDSIDVKAKLKDGSLETISSIGANLVLEKYPSKQLVAIVKDGDYKDVSNASVIWKSSKPDVAKVDSNGKVTAIAKGKTTITATADTVSKSVEINVLGAPDFTDFSKAKFELPFDTITSLKISGITPKEDSIYYYIITTTDKAPTLKTTTSGYVDTENMDTKLLNVNKDEKNIYAHDVDKYVELSSDMYLWVIEQVKLEDNYYDDNDKGIGYDSKFVVSAKKLTKPTLPKLNEILKAFFIDSNKSEKTQDKTYLHFIFPTATENRKFTLKLGKVTDYTILNKIHNNDYSGITSLLAYAKKDNAPIYNKKLTTTEKAFYRMKSMLLDGEKLLANKTFYYIYAEFDDENGKYEPVEAVTLGQAWISNRAWGIYAYSDEKVEWTNLSTTPTEPTKTKPTKETNEVKIDNTTAKGSIPQTGESVAIFTIIGVTLVIGTIGYIRYRKNNF